MVWPGACSGIIPVSIHTTSGRTPVWTISTRGVWEVPSTTGQRHDATGLCDMTHGYKTRCPDSPWTYTNQVNHKGTRGESGAGVGSSGGGCRVNVPSIDNLTERVMCR
jgi:hypothetical protein